jgi:hypothetical protein
MNKEQWVFLASLGLLALGVYFTVTGWMQEKPFQPPAAGLSRDAGAGDAAFTPPLFASEDDLCEFQTGGRNPFTPNRETEPLPLATLAVPPLPAPHRVTPGPVPGLGRQKMRPLEEPLPVELVDLTATGAAGEDDEEDEDEYDEWDRRRW